MSTIVASSISAVRFSSLGCTATTRSGLPSGSESLASTCTDTVAPGRTFTSSSIATGLRASVSGGLMPMRTVPVARAPSESETA